MTAQTEASALTVSPVGGRIGAVIEGVRLSDRIDDAAFARIREALLKHKVIIFRGQDDVGDAAMENFVERLGDPIPHPNAADPNASRYLLDLAETAGYAASTWHSDMTFMPAYPAASILRAIEPPEAGGDTMWANCATAYQDLPEPLRAMADRLRAIHTNVDDFDADFTGEIRERVEPYAHVQWQKVFETEHPVVRIHPETGERVLLVGKFVRRFVGLDGKQTHLIYTLLQDVITKPENCLRWHWRPGDIAVWDNRATQHRSVADFGDQRRRLCRATVQGDVPVGVDGFESRAVKSPEPAA